jgi:hypothetical protein
MSSNNDLSLSLRSSSLPHCTVRRLFLPTRRQLHFAVAHAPLQLHRSVTYRLSTALFCFFPLFDFSECALRFNGGATTAADIALRGVCEAV